MVAHKIRAYASSFVAYLLRKLDDDLSAIYRIILYGSVARGEATTESDVDIFIDTEKDLKKKINDVLEKFYEGREATLFKAQGVDNEINVKASEKPIGSTHGIIFYWDSVGKNRGAFLNKLYGFKARGKQYNGLLEKYSGRRIGKSCILVPINHKDEMVDVLKKYKVNAKNIEIFSLS